MAKTVIGLDKTEVIDRRAPWHELQAAERAFLAFGLLLKAAASLSRLLRCCSQRVDWFDNRRLLRSIGNIPPAEAEAAFYDALENKPIAASVSNQPASGKSGAVQRRIRVGATKSSAGLWGRNGPTGAAAPEAGQQRLHAKARRPRLVAT